MSRTSTVGRNGRRQDSYSKSLLFKTELPISPTDRKRRRQLPSVDIVDDLTEQLTFFSLDDGLTLEPFDIQTPADALDGELTPSIADLHRGLETTETAEKADKIDPIAQSINAAKQISVHEQCRDQDDEASAPTPETADDLPLDSSELLKSGDEDSIESGLRILTWADMCPPGDRIEKIAEASYAEVYRVNNERGTSIIKAIRLASPIKPQTKAQVRSGLVDEEPHDEEDLRGELTISEWLADIPGFVVYKERYIVRGRAPKELLETHQSFHRRAKRQDPGRLQFYPSPSRYLDDTQFLVIELGDAGKALEDVVLDSVWQLWDVFLHVAIALARAEDQIKFEVGNSRIDLCFQCGLCANEMRSVQHRDLHEGNLCIRQVSQPRDKADDDDSPIFFGYSGLDITILDYGLSRAQDGDDDEGDDHDDSDARSSDPIAFDLEKDLSLFTSMHAAQCKVYRQMRSYLLKGDRVHLPPECHQHPYAAGPDGQPISWRSYHPYTNVLWLAYVYNYLVRNFCGEKQDLVRFRRTTRQLWLHLNPESPPAILSFGSATDVVCFAVEAGWLTEAQLLGGGGDDSFLSKYDRSNVDGSLLMLLSTGTDESVCGNESIIEVHIVDRDESQPRRSPRRRRPVVRYGD